MTIADTIKSMEINLKAAYTAVTNKNGSYATPNLVNLAAAIDSIESSGGLPAIGAYGRILYFDETNPNAPQLKGIALNTEEDFAASCTDGDADSNITISDVIVPKKNIFKFEFGTEQITSIPDYFCANFANLLSLGNIPQSVTTIGNNFMYKCLRHDQAITFPHGLSQIGIYFMAYNANRTMLPDLYSTAITTLPDYFCAYCPSLYKLPLAGDGEPNSSYRLPTNLTSIGNFVLGECQNFNQPILFPESLETIGSNFLYHAISFDQNITIGPNITSIGSRFMQECINYDSAISITGKDATMADRFLSSSYMYSNGSVTLGGTWTSIGKYFCYAGTYFNAKVHITGNNLAIEGYFMWRLPFMSKDIIIDGTVKSIGSYSFGHLPYLSSASNISSTVYGAEELGLYCFHNLLNINIAFDLSSIKKMGTQCFCRLPSLTKQVTFPAMSAYPANFFESNTLYNEPINIPNTVTEIGAYFMNNCTRFNNTITMPNVTKFGSYFMNNCASFSRDITIADNATMGRRFMYGLDNFSFPARLIVGSNPTTASDKYSLATSQTGTRSYTSGITVIGEGASSLTSQLSNSDVSPYRKLITVN